LSIAATLSSLLADYGALALAVAALVGALVGALLVSARTRGLERRVAQFEAELSAKATELEAGAERLRGAREEIATRNHELEAAKARLERFTLEDEVTGLANRRAVNARLESELARMLRHGSALSLVFLELDRLKVPDADESRRQLERLGGFLRDRIRRRADVGGRLEGERLALILPDTPLAGALQVAESFRAGIAARGLAESGGALTASFGVAQAAIDGSDRVVDLVRRAQEALERAQSEGRDRVVAAPTPAVGRS
jgi:diguanylate cyclase (GGDEF)-like protein